MKHKIELTTEEMLCIAQSTERNLQNAIDNNIPRRILFYTNMRNKIQSALSGPVAQRLEQDTHNVLAAGSNPARSTIVLSN
tara:strand:+ start:977 stop:1219 length:243 start_codon:yes stop_codon:yes gene_type:complete